MCKKHGSIKVSYAGRDVNSGDIYLSTDCPINYYDYATLSCFTAFFESGHAWQCHNVDFFWQALKTRAVAVRYFNVLNSKLKELSTLSKEAK